MQSGLKTAAKVWRDLKNFSCQTELSNKNKTKKEMITMKKDSARSQTNSSEHTDKLTRLVSKYHCLVSLLCGLISCSGFNYNAIACLIKCCCSHPQTHLLLKACFQSAVCVDSTISLGFVCSKPGED